jgi:hypothetical protein
MMIERSTSYEGDSGCFSPRVPHYVKIGWLYELTIKKGLCRKPDFVYLFVDLKIYEGDPLSPPEGEAAQAVYPLDPLSIWLTL